MRVPADNRRTPAERDLSPRTTQHSWQRRLAGRQQRVHSNLHKRPLRAAAAGTQGLPQGTTEMGLRNVFAPFGAINDCRVLYPHGARFLPPYSRSTAADSFRSLRGLFRTLCGH